MTRPESLTERVEKAHGYLERRGHVGPVVAVSTPSGDAASGDVDERWEIGSVTKVFTALLLAEMAGAGLVGLADPIGKHLPTGTPLAPKVDQITLEHLACHRSGLPRLPPGLMSRSFSSKAMADPYADVDATKLTDALARVKVRGTPGEARVSYSNLGAGILGYLLGEANGNGYEATLAERVLVPMGLSATSFDDDGLHQGRHRRKPVGPWHLAALAGAGGLRSTARDLLAFLSIIRDQSGPLAPAIAETLRPRQSGRIGIGLGWFMLGDGKLLMHNGGTLGARSEVQVELPTGTLVVVLGDGRGGTAKAAGMQLNPT